MELTFHDGLGASSLWFESAWKLNKIIMIITHIQGIHVHKRFHSKYFTIPV